MPVEIATAVLAAAVTAFFVCRLMRPPKAVPQAEAAPAAAPRVTLGEVQFVRPKPGSVEGLEIRYGTNALVRAVRVGAMNCEHKELLLTMDGIQWNSLPPSQKHDVIAAARSTWAAKMCGDGPDIAYVVVETEGGNVVGRADPHCVTVL